VYVQVPLWGELRSCQVPLLLIAGQLDSKFAGIKRRMMARLRQGLSTVAGTAATAPRPVATAAGDVVAAAAVSSAGAVGAKGVEGHSQAQQRRQLEVLQEMQQQQIMHQWAEVPGAGHAVHVEAPLQLLSLIEGFLIKLQAQQN
jgi:pimeloyl-ACP methyl ester carboxylesterase